MDIPQPPPSSTKTPTSASQEIIKNVPSELSEIKLIPEKTYNATVLQKALNTETSTTLAKQQVSEWLININGKQLKISADIELKPAQTILVKLSNNHDSKLPILLLQATKPMAGVSIHQQPKNISLPIIEQILKTMSQLLNKQISISSGFQALQQNIKIASESSPIIKQTQAPANTHTGTQTKRAAAPIQNGINTLNTQLTTLALASLASNLPKVEDIISSLKTNTSDKLIRNLLQHSGLFFESKQAQSSARPTLQALLNTLDSIKSQYTPTLSPSQQTLNTQQIATLQSILQFKTSNADSNTPASSKPDLKESLILLLSALSKTTQKQANLSASQTLPLAHVQEAIPSSPFNFPNLSTPPPPTNEKRISENESNTGQLLKLLAGMLNKIQFNQLNSLYQSMNQQVEHQTTQSWFFELPLMEANSQQSTFNLRIDKEKKQQENESSEPNKEIQWKLVLSFDLPLLGPLYIQVNLVPPTISSIIWADNPATYALAKKETKYLESKLQNLGLEVGDIFCKQGQPQQTNTKLDRNLVDIQA